MHDGSNERLYIHNRPDDGKVYSVEKKQKV